MRVTNRASWALIVVAAATLCGCADLAEVHRFRADAATVRDTFQADEAEWQRRLAELPPDHPLSPDAEAALAAAHARRAAADAAVREVDLLIQRAEAGQDALDTAFPWLPEPLGVPIALGGALVLSLLRAAQLKRGLVSVARGLDAAMRDDQGFRDSFRRHADTFRAVQTPAARRAVDEATKDGFMLRLPL